MAYEPALLTLPADKPRVSRLICFFLGALTTLSFAPFQLSYLNVLLVLPLLYVCLIVSPRDAGGHAFWYGLGLFLTGTYWIYISVVVFGEAPVWIALLLPVSLLLTASDVEQRNAYRDTALKIAREIGDAPGARWFVGHWGFQHYLEREGFRAVVPPQYERRYGVSEIERGDWVASARNVSQLDVSRNLDSFTMQVAWRLSLIHI